MGKKVVFSELGGDGLAFASMALECKEQKERMTWSVLNESEGLKKPGYEVWLVAWSDETFVVSQADHI